MTARCALYISYSAQLCSRLRPLAYTRCLFLSLGRLWVVYVNVLLKFRVCTWIYGWLIKLCRKKQYGGRRHLELVFRNSGPPTKSTSWPEHCVKILFQSHYYFPRYGHFNILQIWLKMPIFAPNTSVFGGFDPQTLLFVIETLNSTSLGESASFKV